MKSVKYITAILFFAITTLLLAACGGGGSGDDRTSVPTAPAAGVSITADNAELISADVLGTVDIVEGFRLLGDLLPGVQVNVTGSDFNYPDFFVQQLQRLQALDMSSYADSVSGAITFSPVTQDCVTGTMRISGKVQLQYIPSWIPAVGDQFTIKFYDCEEAGVVLNGTLSMTITKLVPGSPDFDFTSPYTLGLDVVLTVLTMEADGEVLSTDGDMSMELVDNGVGEETVGLRGDSLTAWGGGEVETLTNYDYYFTLNSALPEPVYSYEQEGKLASTVIGGSVSFQMTKPGTMDPPVPFEGVDAGDPYAGEVWITTAADTSLAHVTALPNSVDVQIDVYLADVIVKNIMTTWDTLRSLL